MLTSLSPPPALNTLSLSAPTVFRPSSPLVCCLFPFRALLTPHSPCLSPAVFLHLSLSAPVSVSLSQSPPYQLVLSLLSPVVLPPVSLSSRLPFLSAALPGCVCGGSEWSGLPAGIGSTGATASGCECVRACVCACSRLTGAAPGPTSCAETHSFSFSAVWTAAQTDPRMQTHPQKMYDMNTHCNTEI